MGFIKSWLKDSMEEVALEMYDKQLVRLYKMLLAESEKTMTPLVKVQLDEGACMPVRVHPTDAGADLFCVEGFVVPAHSSVVIDTGVHIQLPPYTVGMIKSKSGLNIKARLNTEGVIDEGYTGSIKICVYNHGDYPYQFEAGDKVSQLVVLPVAYAQFWQVDEIDGGERGDSGFGSTGR